MLLLFQEFFSWHQKTFPWVIKIVIVIQFDLHFGHKENGQKVLFSCDIIKQKMKNEKMLAVPDKAECKAAKWKGIFGIISPSIL